MRKPKSKEVDKIDLSEQFKFITNYREISFLNGKPGKEHYKLLAWFSNQFNNICITEIGTLDGCGALALSYNKSNKVKTFDIHFYPDCNLFPMNVERKLVYDGYINEVIESSLIFYDAKHEGIEELEFLNELIKRNWKGILILDDINLNDQMREFWENITLYKEDWTDIGHSYGTGIVYFE